jgi:hypothetical protein
LARGRVTASQSSMEVLSLEDFAPAVGHAFAVSAGDTPVELILSSAASLPAGNSAGSFRLEFIGPAEPILPQATYSLVGETAAHDIFIVPIAQDSSGTRYEAIFTRAPGA